MLNNVTESDQLIEDACQAFLPMANQMPAGIHAVLPTGEPNDAAMLVPELLVLILRSRKGLQAPMVIHTLNLDHLTE